MEPSVGLPRPTLRLRVAGRERLRSRAPSIPLIFTLHLFYIPFKRKRGTVEAQRSPHGPEHRPWMLYQKKRPIASSMRLKTTKSNKSHATYPNAVHLRTLAMEPSVGLPRPTLRLRVVGRDRLRSRAPSIPLMFTLHLFYIPFQCDRGTVEVQRRPHGPEHRPWMLYQKKRPIVSSMRL